MIYLRTSEEIQKYCKDNNIEKISIFNISYHLEDHHGFSFLGYFHSMLDNGFWTFTNEGNPDGKQNKFLATASVLDFLIVSGVFSDSSGEMAEGLKEFNQKEVRLFGKIEEGWIIEIVAINTGTYYEKYEKYLADRTLTISEDL